jgi:hypothetical protein
VNYVSFLIRLLEVLANVFNRSKKKKYAEDPAGTIANDPDGRVRESDKTFSDLANETERDKTG